MWQCWLLSSNFEFWRRWNAIDILPGILPIANDGETVNVAHQVDNANAEVIRNSLKEFFKTN